MKDEEMAEEYAAKQNLQNVNPSGIVRCKIAEAFLAGLKAGRPQWHDLLKDPKDLPKNKRNVWCDYGDGYGEGFYDKDDGGWWIEGHIYCSTIDAWCEIPTFDKE